MENTNANIDEYGLVTDWTTSVSFLGVAQILFFATITRLILKSTQLLLQ
jgi:hypothetical protein